MNLDVLLTVMGTTLIQSVFGVGVLLFGTPILLALGHNFIPAITILLPISIAINLFQVIKDYNKIDLDFYKSIIFYTTPFIVIFLFIVAKHKINIGMFVGIFVLVIAIKDNSIKLNTIINHLTKHEKLYFIIMGIIHGTSNLGGSLLTALIHSKKYDKDVTRATVAASYATFATFQIATLLFSASLSDINIMENSFYLIVGVIVYFLTETTLYLELNSKSYSKYFSIFLFGSGLLLCVKSISTVVP